MTAYSRVAVVTGANKGIGLAIVRNLALQYPKSSLNSGRLLIYLTARSSDRGEEALKILNSDPELNAANALDHCGGLTAIKFGSLDIDDIDSIRSFRDLVIKENPGGIDILVNNAGIFMHGFDVNIVRTLLKTNYHGTLAMSTEFLPLIRNGGRMVNIASSDGELIPYSEPLKQEFIDASKTCTGACTALMERFAAEVLPEKESPEGWPSAPYGYAVSKAGVIAFTKAMALKAEKSRKTVLINACCPGFVNTDMTNGKGTMTVDEGAKTPVLLALGDIKGISGGFWKQEAVAVWRPSIPN